MSSLFGAVLDDRFTCRVSRISVPSAMAWAYGLNPMAGVIEGIRWSLTGTDTRRPDCL